MSQLLIIWYSMRFSLWFSLLLELHVIVGNVKAVSLPLVLAGQRYTVEPLARAEVKQEPPWAQMGRGTLWNPSQELR